MVITPDQLAYFASIPISRLEEEVANIVAAMHAASARQTISDQHIIRPTQRPLGYSQPIPRTDYQAIAYQRARHDDVIGALYYEDMPLQYHGRVLREAQEVLPVLDGRDSDGSLRV